MFVGVSVCQRASIFAHVDVNVHMYGHTVVQSYVNTACTVETALCGMLLSPLCQVDVFASTVVSQSLI